MLWLEAFHIIFMVTWFAGLFYLPRLFVYHADSTDKISIERFKIMERKLFWGIMTPGAVLTLLLGGSLLSYAWEIYIQASWMQIKLCLVALLVGYHIWCGLLVVRFKQDLNRHSHVWYRWFNEVPVILLIAIILLVELKPTLYSY